SRIRFRRERHLGPGAVGALSGAGHERPAPCPRALLEGAALWQEIDGYLGLALVGRGEELHRAGDRRSLRAVRLHVPPLDLFATVVGLDAVLRAHLHHLAAHVELGVPHRARRLHADVGWRTTVHDDFAAAVSRRRFWIVVIDAE